MKLGISVIAGTLSLAGLASAAIDYTTYTVTAASTSYSVYPTTVWVTTTLAGGGVATIASLYKQSFYSFYTEVETPKSGSIGLGTISGTIGTVKPVEYVTVTSS